MTSNVSDICNETNEHSVSEEHSYDIAIVKDNTSPENGTVSECEQQFNDAVFKMPKKAKTQFKTASEKVAEPMMEFLKSRTKPVSVEDSSELLFFKSLIPDYKKIQWSKPTSV